MKCVFATTKLIYKTRERRQMIWQLDCHFDYIKEDVWAIRLPITKEIKENTDYIEDLLSYIPCDYPTTIHKRDDVYYITIDNKEKE